MRSFDRLSVPFRTPRRSGPGGTVDAVLSCRLRIALPDEMWLRALSMRNPSLQIDVTDRLDVGRSLTLFEVRIPTEDVGGWGPEIRKLPYVREVALVGMLPGAGVYRVLFAGPTFLPILKRLRLMQHLPFPVRDGFATWSLVAPERKIRQLIRELDSDRTVYQVESVRPGPVRRVPSSLTPRQQEVLQRAVAEGYFDVPRRISLTKLAARLEIAASTLSVTLAVIEKKILEPHL